MECIEASIAAVGKKQEAIERVLSGEGSYLGLRLGGGAAAADEGRKELLSHLKTEREREATLLHEKLKEKAYERDEKAKEKAHEREREATLLHEKAKEKAHERGEKAKEKAHEREREATLLHEKAKEKAYKRDEKAHERDEKAKERALEREKELLLLRFELQPPARSHHPDGKGEEEIQVGERKGCHKRKRGASATEGRVSSHRAESGSCAHAFGMKEVYGKVMELVGQGEYAFVATVCKEWRGYYIVAHPAETSQRSVVASIERVYWARRHGYELTVSTLRAAARYEGASLCKALVHIGCPRDKTVYRWAVLNERHRVSVLKSLCCDDSTACADAAERGDLDLLELLVSDEVDALFDEDVWRKAAQRGRVSVLEWLLNNPKVRAKMKGTWWEHDAWWGGPLYAAGGSHLYALQWMHANVRQFCYWNEDVCVSAVQAGNSLEVLQWLRSEEVGCPWDGGVCPEIIRRNYEACGQEWDTMAEDTFEEIKEWVHASGHPCDCED